MKKILIIVAAVLLVAGIALAVFFLVIRPRSNSFEDVTKDDFFYDAVKWAVKEGIAGGTYDKHFSPNEICTRGQAMTFLWRASGSPAPSDTDNPFPDVLDDMYYRDAILWARERGITGGTDEGGFWPDGPITRGQAVVFLYRAIGSPNVTADLSFDDVSPDDYYEAAVRWATEAEITTGVSETTFAPHQKCSRGQMLTFLYRCFG